VRGEDISAPRREAARYGSPPRAWGRREFSPCDLDRLRFTPTCVGKTADESGRQRQRAVHPHVRGEDVVIIVVAVGRVGSPPRAWGRPG